MDNSLVIMRDHITRGCYAKCVRTVLRQVDSHYYIEELYEKRLGAPSTCWQMVYDGAANHFNKCAQVRETHDTDTYFDLLVSVQKFQVVPASTPISHMPECVEG